jgi:hypothetical protein
VKKSLTIEDIRSAWAAGRELLLKGEVSSPGYPAPPPAPHKRAPNRLKTDPRRFFDPVAQESRPAAPESVQPITQGDLLELQRNSAVEKMPQRSTGVKSTLKVGAGLRASASLRDDALQTIARRTNNAEAVSLQQQGKRLARTQGKAIGRNRVAPVMNAPRHFDPV